MKVALAEYARAAWKCECGDRWRTISRLWEENKSAANKLDLLGRLDYYGNLSSHLEWRKDPRERPVRVVYGGSGTPTAAMLCDDSAIVENTLFWIACRDNQEAYYLLAIINSQELYDAVKPMMPKGQYGARHLRKHLWKLPIPEFDADVPLHAEISDAGRAAAAGRGPTTRRTPRPTRRQRLRHHRPPRTPRLAPHLPPRHNRRGGGAPALGVGGVKFDPKSSCSFQCSKM